MITTELSSSPIVRQCEVHVFVESRGTSRLRVVPTGWRGLHAATITSASPQSFQAFDGRDHTPTTFPIAARRLDYRATTSAFALSGHDSFASHGSKPALRIATSIGLVTSFGAPSVVS